VSARYGRGRTDGERPGELLKRIARGVDTGTEMQSRAESAQVPLGQWIAALGAVGLLATLFRPWYELNLPEQLLSEADALAPRMGELGPLLTEGLAELERAGPLTVTAWQVFESADLVLAGLAVAVLAVVALGTAGGRASGLGVWIARLGTAAAGLVLFKLLSPPGASPQLTEQLLDPQPAVYLALVCAMAITAGGAISTRAGA